jgi:hypothetical protein
MKSLAVLELTAATLLAQSGQPSVPPTGSVCGRILDADTGGPIPGVSVRLLAVGSPPVETHTDAQGNYKFADVNPGPHPIALGLSSSNGVRQIGVGPGEAVTGVDFRIRLNGEISARNYDENKDPVVALQVHVIMREYQGGAIRYFTLETAVDSQQRRYVRDLPGFSNAAQFTHWVTTAVSANACGWTRRLTGRRLNRRFSGDGDGRGGPDGTYRYGEGSGPVFFIGLI